MKKILYKKHLLLFLFLLAGTSSFAQWQKVNDVDSFTRSRPASFVIGDTAYLANGDPGFFVYTADLHGYTQNSNTWYTLRPYPGGGGDWGIRFQIGDTAYVGGGANPGWQNDFYKYTPTTGWTSLGNTPNAMNMGSNNSFSIGNYGYVCGGDWYGTAIDSFWQYNPIANTWKSLAPFQGGKRQSGVAFAEGGYGYVGLGGDGSGRTYRDMYRYTPTTNVWDTMAPVPADTGFSDAGFFVLCGKLVVTMGDTVQSGTSTTRQTWLFDPTVKPKGKWTRLPDYPGLLPAYAPGAFAMGDTGFIYGGWNQDVYNDRAEMYRFVANKYLVNMLVAPLDTSVCSGTPVTLNGNGAASYLWSTTDTTASITITPQKDTLITVTETSGNCIFLDSVTIQVTPGPAVTITPNPATVCAGQSVLLTASGATTFQWVGTGNTTDTLTVSPSKDTTYELLASNGSCSKDTFVAVHTGGVLSLNILPQSPTICAGQTLILKVSGGYTYDWSPSAGLNTTTGDSVVANPTASVTYTVTSMDTLGCSGSQSDTVTVVPAPNVPTITQHGDTLVSSASTDNQWFLNGTLIAGATGPYLIIGKSTESYTVAVENPADGCTSTSAPLVTSGINQLSINSSQLFIYPNPTNGNLYINISASVSDVNNWNLRLTDVLGRTIYTRNSLNYLNTIDLSSLSGGVYFISIISTTGQSTFPIVKE